MNKILKVLFLYFAFLYTQLFGCATCALMTPTATVSIDLHVKENTIKEADFKWLFGDFYTSTLLLHYDKNSNKKLDEDELKEILKIKLDYMLKKSMLTKIKYAIDDSSKEFLLKAKYSDFNLTLQNNNLVMTYKASMDLKLRNDLVLSFIFEDDEGFFGFIVKSLKIDGTKMKSEKNLYLFTASVIFLENSSSQPLQEESVSVEIKSEPKSELTLVEKSIEKIKSLFEDIKNNNSVVSYLLLLFFAYIYGLIHAMGPGHGKTLVGSYFLSNDRSYSKALFVSLMIGVVHTFSAFLLTLVIYFIINTLFDKIVDNSIYYTTKISALIIIFIAVHLLYKKYKAYKELKSIKQKYTFSVTPHLSTCSCGSCKVDKNSTDAALIISAGIVPCPGTVTLFIFSLSLGLYFVGFLSALMMSLGMSTIIYIAALFSVSVRKKTSKDHVKLKMFLEYGSLVIIFVLGMLLFFI